MKKAHFYLTPCKRYSDGLTTQTQELKSQLEDDIGKHIHTIAFDNGSTALTPKPDDSSNKISSGLRTCVY